MTHWEGNPYRRPNSPFWHIVFEDAAGIVRRRSTKTRDLRLAREMLADQLRAVERTRAGHVDRYAATRSQPVARLIDEYKAHLDASGAVARYVRGTIRQIREFVSFAEVTTLASIAVADADRYLERIRAKRSARTRDHYATALRTFGRWLVRTGRWDHDPFQGLASRTANRDKHRVFRRLSFRYEEAERLVEAAWARFEAERARGGTATHDHGESVRDRQVLYWFALTTGFRAKECASIRWEDLTLAHGKPAVRLAGQFTKNGDDALVPLQPFVAEAMARMRTRRSAHHMRAGSGPVVESDLVFHVPDKIARLVRKDAAFAGLIPLAGITTRRVDFHALRKSCARILIELGLHPKVIQQTLRHSDIRLTMDLYGELGEDDLFRELPGRVPVPRMFGVGGVG